MKSIKKKDNILLSYKIKNYFKNKILQALKVEFLRIKWMSKKWVTLE